MMLPDGVRRVLRLRRDVENQVVDEVDEEVHFHLLSRIDDLLAEGRSREEAEGLAVREFGDVEGATRALRRRAARVERSARRVEWWSDLGRDLRHGWRKLVAEPVFAAVAVLTLALGVGANTAIFSVVHAVLLRPLPYPQAERLVTVWEITPEGDARNVVSRGNFMDWRDRVGAFEALGAYGNPLGTTFRDRDGRAARIRAVSLTPEVFRALGVPAAEGRTFTPEEGLPGNASVAVLGHGFWLRRFGGDAAAVGRDIELEGNAYTVVGVMPPEFDFPSPDVDVWTPWPLDEEDRQNRRSHNLNVVGRLASGSTLEGARAELDALAARLAELHPEDMTGWGVNVQPFRADLVAAVRPLLLVLLGVVGLVLLLACANLANLLLARALAREREVAVRGALGAGRGRLVRQLLTEAALLAVLGGGLGFVATALGMDAFVALAPADIPLLDDVRVDPVVLGFAVGVTLLAMLLFGLLPALRATAGDLQSSLRTARDGATAPGRVRLRSGLMVVEVALAVVLLVGSALLLRSVVALQRQDYGFDRTRLLTVQLDLPQARYGGGTPDHVAFYQRLLQRVSGLPGVTSVAGSTDLPAGFGSMTFSFAIEGRPRAGPRPREEPQPLRIVTPRYFRTLGIPLREGRTFTSADGPDAAPVLVVNEALKRLHWPDASPVGTRISFEGQEGPWLEIVGVVGDTRHYGVDAEPGPAIYMPHAQKRWDWASWLNVIARTGGDPLAVAPAFRSALADLDPLLVPGRIARLDDLYSRTNARRRFATVLLGAFAGLALVLGTVGVYGVLSYSVAGRTREMGVRLALGASRGRVAARVVGDGLRLALAGAVLGVAAALLLAPWLEGLVYGVGVRDPLVFTAVPLLLLATAGLAAWLPARRATRVDPAEALRAG